MVQYRILEKNFKNSARDCVDIWPEAWKNMVWSWYVDFFVSSGNRLWEPCIYWL